MGHAIRTTGIYLYIFKKKHLNVCTFLEFGRTPRAGGQQTTNWIETNSGLTAKLCLCISVTLSYFVSPAMSELQMVVMQTRPTYAAFLLST